MYFPWMQHLTNSLPGGCAQIFYVQQNWHMMTVRRQAANEDVFVDHPSFVVAVVCVVVLLLLLLLLLILSSLFY